MSAPKGTASTTKAKNANAAAGTKKSSNTAIIARPSTAVVAPCGTVVFGIRKKDEPSNVSKARTCSMPRGPK